MSKRNKTKKSFKSNLKLEALEQRQLLAGVSGSGTEVTPGGTGVLGDTAHFIQHPNGNKYDQVLLTGPSVSIQNDAGQVTRVSFLDLQGDIVQAEFSGAGTFTVSMDTSVGSGYQTGITSPTGYNQTLTGAAAAGYTKGLASFSISGSDSTSNITIFSVGSTTAINSALFDSTHTGGTNHTADVQRITIVADPSNPNGSTFGGIFAGNAVFSAESGVVGISAAGVQVQNVVTVGDIKTSSTSTATPTLVFGTNSQFGSVTVAGGGLVEANGKSVNNAGSYNFGLVFAANADSNGAAIAAQTPPAGLTFTGNDPIAAQTKTFTLTTGVDTFSGTSGPDKFIATETTITGLDSISGGAGSDALIITDVTGATADITKLTASGIESFQLTSNTGLNGGSLDLSGYTGLTSAAVTLAAPAANQTVTVPSTASVTESASKLNDFNLTIQGGTAVTLSASNRDAGTITVGSVTAPTGAVSITSSTSGNYTDGANNTIGATTITGGSSVTVAQTASTTSTEAATALNDTSNFSIIQGSVTVNGKSGTTAVTVTQSAPVTKVDDDGTGKGKIGISTGAVTVADVNATSGTAAGSIASVSLTNYAASTIDSSALTSITLAGTGTSLGIGRGALTATPTANTLTINLAGGTHTSVTDSEAAADDGFTTVNLAATSASTITTLDIGDATTVNFTGTAAATVTTLTAANVTAITNSGTGAATIGSMLPVAASYTGGSGVDTITVGATTKAIATGDGNDVVTLASGTTALGTGGSIDGGAGTADVLTMVGADAATASGSTTFQTGITGFERLAITTPAATTINLANLKNINYVSTSGGTGVTFNNMASGGTLFLSGASTTTNVNIVDTGTADSINLLVGNGSATVVDGTITTPLVETVNIVSDNTATSPGGGLTAPGTGTSLATTMTLTDVDATTINLSGDLGVNLTFTGGKVTTVNASGLTKQGLNWTASALNAAATVTGGAGVNVIDMSSAGKAVTVTGGASADAITGSALASTLNGGAGDDTITGGLAADTINGGDGVDRIVGGGGLDQLTGGAGNDTFVMVVPTNGNSYATITDLAAGDKIQFMVDHGTETFNSTKITLADTAVFQDFLDAGSASATAGSGNGVVRWFQFGGNTYVVNDASDTPTFANGTDTVVRINGLVDLSNSTVGNGAGTGVPDAAGAPLLTIV